MFVVEPTMSLHASGAVARGGVTGQFLVRSSNSLIESQKQRDSGWPRMGNAPAKIKQPWIPVAPVPAR